MEFVGPDDLGNCSSYLYGIKDTGDSTYSANTNREDFSHLKLENEWSQRVTYVLAAYFYDATFLLRHKIYIVAVQLVILICLVMCEHLIWWRNREEDKNS